MIRSLTFKQTDKRHGEVTISYSDGTKTVVRASRAYAQNCALNDGLPWVAPDCWGR